jgi:O-antigen ligase
MQNVSRPTIAGVPPITVVLVIGGAIATSILASQLDIKGLMVLAGVGVLVAGMFVVRDRPLYVLVLLVLTLQVLLHKKFGELDKVVNSGAPLIYISSIYVWLVVLYVLWLLEGTMAKDLIAGSRNPLLWLPLVAATPAIFSLLVATDLQLAVAELYHMAWMYMLFVYVALRVRNQKQLTVLVGALLSIALVQAVVVLLQWRTGGSLGLGFLGEQSVLGVRATDAGVDLTRPSGTVVHPDFLAALVAPIGLISLSLAINLKRSWQKWACLAAAPIGFLPLAISQTRAALLGAAVATVLLAAGYLKARRLSWQPIAITLGAAALATAVFWDRIRTAMFDNLGTDQFQLEIDARVQLNNLALAMIKDHPILGVGINNFQAVMGQYDRYGLIFAGNPVHNLYLLIFAETGFFGLLTFLVLGAALLTTAMRAIVAQDRLVGGLAAGIASALVFFAVEELLAFSVREEMPFAMLAMLAGLIVVCRRLYLQERLVARHTESYKPTKEDWARG